MVLSYPPSDSMGLYTDPKTTFLLEGAGPELWLGVVSLGSGFGVGLCKSQGYVLCSPWGPFAGHGRYDGLRPRSERHMTVCVCVCQKLGPDKRRLSSVA